MRTPPFLFGGLPYQVVWNINPSGVEPKKEIETERNMDLENCLGNLLIAEYQVHRLKERLVNMLSTYNKKGSAYSFKMGGSWFNVTVAAERDVKVEPTTEPEKLSCGCVGNSCSGHHSMLPDSVQVSGQSNSSNREIFISYSCGQALPANYRNARIVGDPLP